MSTRAPIIVSLGLYKASGGPVKTIGKFRQALGANLFSFVDAKQYQPEADGIEGASVIQSVKLPFLSTMCYPQARDQKPH